MSYGFYIRRFITLVLMLLLVGGAVLQAYREQRAASAVPRPTVILDPGHGGVDAGAVGVNGCLEKELNLLVARELCSLLREAGVGVIMTREEDTLLLGEGQDIRGRRKYYDLRNRLAVAQRYPEAVFVSIHMNAYPVPKYRGMQVFAAKGEGSRALAEAIRISVTSRVQPENHRAVKEGGSIFLLSHAPGCAVLVECGFLSNPEDAQSLSQEDTRRELSFAIFCGIMEYLNEGGGAPAPS